jgi:hypothetical protein
MKMAGPQHSVQEPASFSHNCFHIIDIAHHFINGTMAKPNLLLCFDAFGTLFRPKAAAPQQYAEVARQLGIVGFTDSELQTTLKAAIKNESTKNPNYGKATGLGATQWWTNVRPQLHIEHEGNEGLC